MGWTREWQSSLEEVVAVRDLVQGAAYEASLTNSLGYDEYRSKLAESLATGDALQVLHEIVELGAREWVKTKTVQK